MSWVKINQLNEKRAALITEADALNAKAESREFTADETARFEAIKAETKAIGSQLTRISEVRSLDDALRQAGHVATPNKPAAPAGKIGLGREQRMSDFARDPSLNWLGNRSLSIGKIIKGLATGSWSDAEDEYRAMSGGSAAGGGYLLPIPVSNEIIDLTRNASAVINAGARTLPMDGASLRVPRVTADPAIGWRAENAAFASGDPTFETVTLTPKTLGGIVKTSIELADDVVELGTVVAQMLSKAIATELDRASLRGSGTGSEPLGLKGTTGIQTMATVGTVTSYSPFSRAAQKVMQANGTPTGIITSPRVLGDLSSLVDTTNQPLNPPKILEPLTLYPTNNIPTNLGTGSDESEAFVGQWDQLVIGMRSQILLEASRYSDGAFGNGQIHIRAFLRGDLMVQKPSHFVYMSGLKSPA